MKLMMLAIAALAIGCSPKPTTAADILQAAKPAVTAPVDLATPAASAEKTSVAIQRAKESAAVAKSQAETAQAIAQRQALTIVELQQLVAQTDEDIDAKIISLKESAREIIAKLEKEIAARERLDRQRQVTISNLNDDLTAAAKENAAVKSELAKALAADAERDAELERYRQLYTVAVDATREAEETAAAIQKDTAKYKSYWDSRWGRNFKLIGFTSLAWVILLIWQFLQPSNIASSLFARGLRRS